jgi:hypothetical protein
VRGEIKQKKVCFINTIGLFDRSGANSMSLADIFTRLILLLKENITYEAGSKKRISLAEILVSIDAIYIV